MTGSAVRPPMLTFLWLLSADVGSSTVVAFSAFLNGRYPPADLTGDITVSYSSPTGTVPRSGFPCWPVGFQSKLVFNQIIILTACFSRKFGESLKCHSALVAVRAALFISVRAESDAENKLQFCQT